jgi:T4-like virus tail tube protein gp19
VSEDWAKSTGQLGNEVARNHLRKNVQIEVYNQAGQPVLRYNLYNCLPSEYTPLLEPSSEANAVALASMTIEHEGRDPDAHASQLADSRSSGRPALLLHAGRGNSHARLPTDDHPSVGTTSRRELRIPAASDSAYGSDHAPASDDQRESIRGRGASRIRQTKQNSGLPCFPRCTRISTEQMSAPQCAERTHYGVYGRPWRPAPKCGLVSRGRASQQAHRSLKAEVTGQPPRQPDRSSTGSENRAATTILSASLLAESSRVRLAGPAPKATARAGVPPSSPK